MEGKLRRKVFEIKQVKVAVVSFLMQFLKGALVQIWHAECINVQDGHTICIKKTMKILNSFACGNFVIVNYHLQCNEGTWVKDFDVFDKNLFCKLSMGET